MHSYVGLAMRHISIRDNRLLCGRGGRGVGGGVGERGGRGVEERGGGEGWGERGGGRGVGGRGVGERGGRWGGKGANAPPMISCKPYLWIFLDVEMSLPL